MPRICVTPDARIMLHSCMLVLDASSCLVPCPSSPLANLSTMLYDFVTAMLTV